MTRAFSTSFPKKKKRRFVGPTKKPLFFSDRPAYGYWQAVLGVTIIKGIEEWPGSGLTHI